MTEVQENLYKDPTNNSLILEEKEAVRNFCKLSAQEEQMFRQKSRIQWLKEGDKNTAYFHQKVKSNWNHNKIQKVKDNGGHEVYDKEQVKEVFVRYFSHLFNDPTPSTPMFSIFSQTDLFEDRLNPNETQCLITPIEEDEIKAALFSLHPNKAPGPDGFNGFFHRVCWDIIQSDFVRAVKFFFITNRMSFSANATSIALIPKVKNADQPSDYRPIACCSTILKCISKILAARLKPFLSRIISPIQTAFVPSRSISDNILLAQELVQKYNQSTKIPKCAMKIDFKKAYDTINWRYLFDILESIGIPPRFIQWIRGIITTAHFSISINGELAGFFRSTRGLRQGDPLSPYLFVIAMEGLTRIIQHEISRNNSFKYHWRCEKQNITHLCFADDLILFCRGESRSIKILWETCKTFFKISGLSPNQEKSSILMNSMSPQAMVRAMEITGLNKGSFPLKYLGLPLQCSGYKAKDCTLLIEKITARVKNWTSAFLSYGGRLQLIKSVLFSMSIYWASHTLLPTRILDEIKKIIRRFLWKGTSLQKGSCRVAWSNCTLPIAEGGLGIKDLPCWNRALMGKMLWKILRKEENSVWAIWCHHFYVKNQSIWMLQPSAYASLAWKNINETQGFFSGRI